MFRALSKRIPSAFSLLFLAGLAACGGGGGAGGALPALGGSHAPMDTATASPSPIPLPTGVIAVSAQIAGIDSKKMTVQAGPGCGYMYVYYNSSTAYFDGSPKVGQWGVFTGTGRRCYSITANSVSLSATQASGTTLTGTIAGSTTYGFTLSSNGASIPVALTSATTVTDTLLVGDAVSVTGLGSADAGLTASAITVSATPAPAPSPTATPPAATQTPTPAPTSAPGVISSPAPSGSPIPVPSGVLAVSGQIAYVTSTRLSVQGGSGCGYYYLYLNSGTTYFNGSPKVGQYAEFTGPGTKCSSVTAQTVYLSSTALASTSTSGTVVSQQSYGFTLNTGSATIPVAMSSSTVVYGAALTVGSNVTVTGIGSTATALTATQIAVQAPATPAPTGSPTPTPGPISMTHVLVGGLVYGYGGTPTNVSATSIAQYLNWAETGSQYVGTLKAVGIKTIAYTNFWRNYTTDNPQTGYTDLKPGGAHADAEAKDCSGNPVYDTAYGGGYEADARASDALAHAQVTTNNGYAVTSQGFDALFSDDTGSVWGVSLPCNYSQSAYDAAVNSVHSALGVSLWVNALGAAPNPATAIDLTQPANVVGAMCELCYGINGSSGDYIQTGTSWLNVENAEIGMAAQQKIFWDYARLTGDPSLETGLRTYVYASFLLGYDPSYSMLQEAFATPSGFPVMPETGLVAENPLTTASSVSGYQAPGGAYFREFAACYYRGAFVSNCAVAVNPGGTSVPVPSTSYSHSLSLSGSGVLDGGSATFTGGTVSQLAPGTAAILFP